MIPFIRRRGIPFIWKTTYVVGGVFIGCVLALLNAIFSEPNKKTKRIAILGHTLSGKSTLWKGLQYLERQNDRNHKATHYEEIKEFEMSVNKEGKKITIAESADIGGDYILLEEFIDKVVRDDTHIFYLIDATKLAENEEEIKKHFKLIEDYIRGLYKDIPTDPLELNPSRPAEVSQKELKNVTMEVLFTHVDQEGFDINAMKEFIEKNNIKSSKNVNLLEMDSILRIRQGIIDSVKE